MRRSSNFRDLGIIDKKPTEEKLSFVKPIRIWTTPRGSHRPPVPQKASTLSISSHGDREKNIIWIIDTITTDSQPLYVVSRGHSRFSFNSFIMAVTAGTQYNYLLVFFVALGSFTYGFNNSIMGTVFALDSFFTYFDLPETGPRAGHTTTIISSKQAPCCSSKLHVKLTKTRI